MKNNCCKIIFLIFLSVVWINCSNEDDSFIFRIADDKNNELKFSEYPKRIISLSPAVTETFFELGSDSLLVGVTNYCDFPEKAKEKRKVGGILDPNIEVISILKPDLIILTTEGNSISTYNSLKNMDYKIFVTSPKDFNGIFKMILDIGKITKNLKKADEIVEKIKKEYLSLDSLSKNSQKVKCVALLSVSPLITFNKNVFINEVLTLSGFDNVFKNELNDYPSINYESIYKNNPDVLFFITDTNNYYLNNDAKNLISKNLANTTIVKKNKIFFIDENIISRPSIRVIKSVYHLKKIYEDSFK